MKQKQTELKRYLFGVLFALLIAFGLAALLFVFRDNVAFFNPAGTIAREQRDLFIFTTLLMMIVVIPVFIMLFVFAWKFREGNEKAKYRPNWDHNNKLEMLWWGIPIAIIAVLAVVTWVTSHTLDPFRAIEHEKQPVKVQVVAMEWKWLFIYEETGIASVNELHLPTDRPVEFTITSDGAMNSFWIPKLGSQIYAMAGMSTKLNLLADKTGVFEGVSANISGEGFADMKFSVVVTNENEFNDWQKAIQSLETAHLDKSTYAKLAERSIEKDPRFYSGSTDGLYESIVHSYMKPDNVTPRTAEVN